VSDPREIVTVVTAGRPDVLECMVRAWKRSGNAGWRVRIGIGWDGAELEKALQRDGFWTFSMREAETEARIAFGADFSNHHALWSSKVAAMMLGSRTRWCFWLDHDAEVRGDIGPIVEHGLSLGRWLSAPKYASMGARRWHGRRICQNGMCLVDTESKEIRRWRQAMHDRHLPNDEAVLHRAFGGWAKADRAIGDLYRPDWYASCDCYPESEKSIPLATERLKTSKALVRHWCAKAGKDAFKELYGKETA